MPTNLCFEPAGLWDLSLLTADAVQLRLHKAIVASRCKVFAAMFADTASAGGSAGAPLPVEETFAQLRPLLSHLYPDAPIIEPGSTEVDSCGTADSAGPPLEPWQPAMSPASLHTALEAARKYDCRTLLEACDALMADDNKFQLALGRQDCSGAVPLSQASCMCPGRCSLTPAFDVALSCHPTPPAHARSPVPRGGELISTLALAYSFGLPKAAERCRRQLLNSLAQLPDQLGSADAQARALGALADLPAGVQTATLLMELLVQAGIHAANAQQLERDVCYLRNRCDGYSTAVATHVREFCGASGIRAAINTHVNAACQK